MSNFWIERLKEKLMLTQELMTSPAQTRPTLRGLLFAMPVLSTANGELLLAKVLEWKSFEDDIDREDDEGRAAVFWLTSFEFTAASNRPLDLLFVWSDDNTEADVINTKVAVIKDNTRNFLYCLYVSAVADETFR